MPKIILASGSPRRRDLMNEAGYEFTIVVPDVDEIEDPSIPIEDLTRTNARLKSEAVAGNHPESVVVAADTLVELDGRPLSKPADMEEAFRMISSLNGRTHQVFTAVCVSCVSQGKEVEFSVITDVTFRHLTDDELRHYHSLIEPLDKAGAYAAQDHGSLIIESMHGSRSNVVGLPMDELAEVLAEFEG